MNAVRKVDGKPVEILRWVPVIEGIERRGRGGLAEKISPTRFERKA